MTDKIVKKIDSGLRGIVTIPSDKSISHRAIMFSSLAHGKSIIKNFSGGADCISTLNLFKNLGVNIEYMDKKTVKVVADGNLRPLNSELDCGNSGTTMRLCSGILAGQNFDTVLTGDASLSKRPMKRIITPLEMMGANIGSNEYKAPLKIKGSPLHGIKYDSPIASAQVKSCILLAGLHAEGQTCVKEPYISRNHTELMLKYMGADIHTFEKETIIKKSTLASKEIIVPGDISSAAYFIVAGLVVPDSEIIIKNIGLNPTRTGILDVVRRMGGDVEILNKENISGEDVGDIKVKYSSLRGCNISGEDIPRLIDELPVIALMATQAEGQTVISDAQDLRKKESDRITTITNGLKSLGADIEEKPDGFIINGKTKLTGGKELEVFHDHRLAMTYYTAGLISENEIMIKEFEWINISFPEFEGLFVSLS